MCTIVLDAGTKSGSPMWWRSSFFCITPRMNSANSSSLAPRLHLRVQIVIPDGEQAGANFAVAGDADAAAMSAEGMRDRRDDADFADAVFEAVAAGGFRARVRNFDQRAVLGHARQNFIERDYRVGRPGAVFFERHEFDEANGHAFFAREHAEGNDLIFVEAAHQHAIHFQRPQPGAARGADAGEDVIVSVGHARDAGEAVGIDCVHGDGDAGEAGIFQRLRQFGEQVAVGGERDVEWARRRLPCGVERKLGLSSAHELDYALAQQRLAAGEANFRDPHADQHPRHAQIIGERQVAVERAFVAGAAIDTLVIAAIGDGDPQVGDGAAEFVG